MPRIQPGPDIHITALEKKKVARVNLMHPGSGTPWEDRGHLGVLKAFFATAGASLGSPAKLLRSIRRPETFSDARAYVIACGIMWSLSAVVQGVLWRWHLGDAWDPDDMWYWIGVGGMCALAVGLTYLLHTMATGMLSKLNSAEAGNRAPNVLTYNVLAYVLGPSIFAPIPVVGPVLALVWIVALAVAGSVSRLQLKVSTSVVNVLLTTLVVLVTLFGTLLVARILFFALIKYFE